MTISSTASSVTRQGNGAATVFPYGFLIPTAATALVTLVDTSVVPTSIVILNAGQYGITGIGAPAGGGVTYPLAGAPLTNKQFITIQRLLPLIQQTAFSNQGAYLPNTIEGAFDYITMVAQQLAAQIGNSLQRSVSDSSGVPPAILADSSTLANQPAAWDANGNLIAGQGAAGGIIINAAMTGLVQAASIALARAFLGSTAIGDALYTAASAIVARATLGLGAGGAGIGLGMSVDANSALAALLHGGVKVVNVDATHNAVMPVGLGLVLVSGAVCQLPAAGLSINGAACTINGAGGAVAISTVYQAYLTAAAGVLGVDLRTGANSGHMTSTTAGNRGVEVRSNGGAPDDTHTYIGLWATDAAGHFYDVTATAVGIANWFNRRHKAVANFLSATTGTASTPLVVLNGTLVSVLTFADDAVSMRASGWASGTLTNAQARLGIGVDGVLEDTVTLTQCYNSGALVGVSLAHARNLAEGLHAVDLRGGGDGTNTTSYQGGGVVGARCTVEATAYC